MVLSSIKFLLVKLILNYLFVCTEQPLVECGSFSTEKFLNNGKLISCVQDQPVNISQYIRTSDSKVNHCFTCDCPDGQVRCTQNDTSSKCIQEALNKTHTRRPLRPRNQRVSNRTRLRRVNNLNDERAAVEDDLETITLEIGPNVYYLNSTQLDLNIKTKPRTIRESLQSQLLAVFEALGPRRGEFEMYYNQYAKNVRNTTSPYLKPKAKIPKVKKVISKAHSTNTTHPVSISKNNTTLRNPS